MAKSPSEHWYRIYTLGWDWCKESRKAGWVKSEDQIHAVAWRSLEMHLPAVRLEGVGGFLVELWPEKATFPEGEPEEVWLFDECLRPVPPSEADYHAHSV